MAEQEQQQQQQQQLDHQSRSTGKVSWFGDSKGYGFITPDDGGEDLFVHQSSIKSDGYRSLTVGESVEFTVSIGNGGKTQAVDVTAIGGSPINKRDRRGGGWRGGNDRRNAAGCYNCGDLDHLARDCDMVRHNSDRSKKNNSDFNNNGGGDDSCYNCGGFGHFARDCRRDNNAGGGAGKCYNCGKFGHFARDCNSRVAAAAGGGGGGACYVCGNVGHLARDCNSSRGSGGAARFERFDSGGCFNCGEKGHFARECPNVQASA